MPVGSGVGREYGDILFFLILLRSLVASVATLKGVVGKDEAATISEGVITTDVIVIF